MTLRRYQGRGPWGYGASHVTRDKREPDTVASLERDLAEYRRLLRERPELWGTLWGNIARTERKLVKLKARGG